MRNLKITFVIIMLSIANLFSAVYKVGFDKPYKTLVEVANLLQSNDTVKVDGNQSYPGDVVFSRPAMPYINVVIQGIKINNKRPVISGSGSVGISFDPYPMPGMPDNIIIEGFEITGNFTIGIENKANGLTIRDCHIHNISGTGIASNDPSAGSITLEYSEVNDCGSGGNYDQISVATDEISHPSSVFRMQHNYIHDGASGSNILSKAERNEIYYNYIEGAYSYELVLVGPDTTVFVPSLKREDSDICGNVIVKKSTIYSNEANWWICLLGGDGNGASNGRYRFANNTIISGTSGIFRLLFGIESLELHNNVLHNPLGMVTVKRSDQAWWTTAAPEKIFGFNNWIKSGALQIPDSLKATVYGNDPQFVNSGTGDYHPILSSPLINSGLEPIPEFAGLEFTNPLPIPLFVPPLAKAESFQNAKSRYIAGNLDIGAYEYRQSHIEVSGTITANTVWDTDSVLVTGDLTINKWIELEIKPGTIVKVNPNAKIEVKGLIKAIGLPEKKIVFTSSASKSLWHGFHYPIHEDMDSSVFKYCIFKNCLASDGDEGQTNDDDNGGVFLIKSGNRISLSDCIAEDDVARAAGGFFYAENSNITINNCLIRNCQGQTGGAISFNQCTVLMFNNTIVNNSAQEGAALFLQNSQISIYNTILWLNQATVGKPIYIFDNNCDPDFYHCNIEGGLSSLGGLGSGANYNGMWNSVINQNPLFAESGNNGYHLSGSSPCIDFGGTYNTIFNQPIQDIDGNPRIAKNCVDIGAIEYQSANRIENNVASTIDLSYNYPNPFNNTTIIKFNLPQTAKSSLTVYNVKGELVKTLVNGLQNAGSHSVSFDGAGFNSGVYFYKLETDNKSMVKRMLLVK